MKNYVLTFEGDLFVVTLYKNGKAYGVHKFEDCMECDIFQMQLNERKIHQLEI